MTLRLCRRDTSSTPTLSLGHHTGFDDDCQRVASVRRPFLRHPVCGSMTEVARRLNPSRLAAHAAALQEGKHLYETIFERSAVGQLVIDLPSFRIDVVNKAFCAMVGFGVDDLVGQDIAALFPPGQSPANDILERLSDRASEGYVAQRFLQRRDGTILPALVTTAVVRDEDGQPFRLLVSLQDQTQRRASENLEWRSQALIDGAIAALPMTFTAFDTNLRFTYVAGGLAQRGTVPVEFIGRHVREFTTHRPTIAALRNALLGYKFDHADGGER